MSNAHMIVTEKGWQGLSEDERSWLMFNTLQSVERRVTKLESRKWIDKSLTGITGLIGGFLAYLGISLRG